MVDIDDSRWCRTEADRLDSSRRRESALGQSRATLVYDASEPFRAAGNAEEGDAVKRGSARNLVGVSLLLALGLALLGSAPAQAQQRFAPGEILVKYAPGVRANEIAALPCSTPERPAAIGDFLPYAGRRGR